MGNSSGSIHKQRQSLKGLNSRAIVGEIKVIIP